MVMMQSAVAMRVGAAVDEASGQVVDAGPLIGHLLELVAELSAELMARCWQPPKLTTLQAGVDAAGRRLPSAAAVIAARLGWIPQPADGVHVDSRVLRLVQANVVSMLKVLAYRDQLIPHVANAVDEHGNLDDDRLGEQCRGVSGAFARNLARQLRRADKPVTSITELQAAPRIPRIARLGAVDAQLAALEARGSAGVLLRIKLPTTAQPASRADWAWYRLWCPIPAHLQGRDIRRWHLPTVSMHRGAPLLRFAITEVVPDPVTARATAALGIDWSPAALGAASMVTERGGGLVTDARTHVYNDRGMGVRLARLQTEGQQLSAKIDRLSALAANAPEPTRARLHTKIAVIKEHRRAVGVKRRRINRDVAFDFAATMTAMASASGAGVIAVEDLRDLQTRGRGRVNNNRAAQSARRQAYRALEHTAARAGLEVVMCPPRGTSARCPGCDGELARPTGYHSASCDRCGIHGADRDQIAAQNIGKRVLLAKAQVKRPTNKPKRITTVGHRPVTKTRQKTTATPPQRRHKRTRHTTRPIGNHAHPARPASVWDRDQRPAPPESTSAKPIAATRDTHSGPASIRDG
jgi:hypothetical protein